MSTRHFSATTMLGHTLAQAATALTLLRAAWVRRRVVGQLGALDDHMLRDIGITRQDVFSVLAEPMFRDPSLKLAERAQEARAATRATARDALAFGLSQDGATAEKAKSPFRQDRRAA